MRRKASRRFWKSASPAGPGNSAERLWLIARTAQHLARQRVGLLTALDHGYSIYQNILHSFRDLVGILESGAIADRGRIENHDVGPQALFQHTTICQAHPLGW